ncbi:MAG: ABC transporter ATP-binding protein [Devosia sp.]|nr:ABC transporter ATP-binding protein [Devosia sp.]
MQVSFRRERARSGDSRNASTAATPRVTANASSDAPDLERQRRRKRARKFFSYYRPHLPLLAADLGCAVLASTTALGLPLCANYVTKQVMQLSATPEALGQIYLMGAVMLGLLALQIISTFFVDYQGHMMGARIESEVRRELFEHCQKLSFSFYDRNRVGQLMSRITNDSLWLGEVFHHVPEEVAIISLKFVGVIVILMHTDPWLTGIILVLTPFAVVYSLHFARRMECALARSKQEIAAVNERVEDSLSGIRVVQSFANEALETRLFNTANANFLRSRGSGYLSEAWFSAGTASFAQLVTIAVIIIGALRVVEARLSIADMLTFLLCVAVLVDPINRITTAVRWWQDGFTGFARAMEILETEPEIADRPGVVEMPRPQGAIAFRNVSFRYEEDGPHVLDRLSFDIRAGEFVALVGPSGVGKSTLCALIPRFYEPTAGSILIDGRDISEVTLDSLRRHVGVVQQDVYLFAGTIAENLRYGRPEATEAEIVAAAKAADAHDFICALPQRYDTDIGQRGVKLSGGQKQRLTIARAFLKDPAILIFDEATSALDNESERAIQRSLQTLAKGRTTLVIAHRLSTIRRADRLLVLSSRGIVEEGTHDALIASGGAYAALYEAQAGI